MMLPTSAPGWLAAILFLLLLVAALQDIWQLEISNWICAAVAICAFLAMAIGGPIIDLWQNLALCGGVLGLGTLLFARGWMGGGDVKLLAASALWFDLDQGWKMLVAVALIGGLETLVVMLLRMLPWPPRIRHHFAAFRRDEGIPYGVAIAAGVTIVALRIS